MKLRDIILEQNCGCGQTPCKTHGVKEERKPEVDRLVNGLVRKMADRYDYSLQDAVYAIIRVLKSQNYDGIKESNDKRWVADIIQATGDDSVQFDGFDANDRPLFITDKDSEIEYTIDDKGNIWRHDGYKDKIIGKSAHTSYNEDLKEGHGLSQKDIDILKNGFNAFFVSTPKYGEMEDFKRVIKFILKSNILQDKTKDLSKGKVEEELPSINAFMKKNDDRVDAVAKAIASRFDIEDDGRLRGIIRFALADHIMEEKEVEYYPETFIDIATGYMKKHYGGKRLGKMSNKQLEILGQKIVDKKYDGDARKAYEELVGINEALNTFDGIDKVLRKAGTGRPKFKKGQKVKYQIDRGSDKALSTSTGTISKIQKKGNSYLYTIQDGGPVPVYEPEIINEGTELWEDENFTFKRFAGPGGIALQITVPKIKGGGFEYIQMTGDKVKSFARAAVHVAQEFENLDHQVPVNEGIGNKINVARAKSHFNKGEKIAAINKKTGKVIKITGANQFGSLSTKEYDFAYLTDVKEDGPKMK